MAGASKIDVKTLGHSGVIIDQNPLEPTLPDDALRSAQNAMHDPTQGYGGALRKRPGLRRFNLAYAGGAILGGIPIAVSGTGGAPSTGGGGDTGSNLGSGGGASDGGGTGSGIGAGDGTGAPGGTSDGSTVSSFAPAGAGSFGGGSLFGNARLIIIGRDDNTHGTGSGGTGWYVTSKKLANAANLVTSPGPPGRCYSYPNTSTFSASFGQPYVWHPASSFLYYAAQDVDQSSGAAITIRRTNGGIDVAVCTLPKSGGTSAAVNNPSDLTIRYAVLTMHLGADGNIYIGCKDKASGQTTAGNWGAIFKLVPSTGTLMQLNVTTVAGAVADGYAGLPYCIAQFQGYVYWGEHNLGASSDTQKDTNADIHAMTSDQDHASIDHGFSDAEVVGCLYPFPQTAPASDPNMNVQANQILFCGFGVNKTTPTFAWVYSRDRTAPGTSSAFTSQFQSSGGVATNGNGFLSMVAFNDKLYATYYNPGQAAKIYRFTPDYTSLAADGGWDGTGTWATAYTALSIAPLYLFVDDGVIYAVGGNGLGGTKLALWSTDGSSWTDGTANAIPASSNQSYPLPILVGFNQ